VSRVVKTLLNQSQAAAFERWSTKVGDLARQQGIMNRILRQMLEAKIAAGQTAAGELAACLSDPCVCPQDLCALPALVDARLKV
jgi:hypothetical protein